METTPERPRHQRGTLTVVEAAEILGISRSSAFQAASNGQLPVTRIGKRLLVPRVALERMLDDPSKSSVTRLCAQGATRADLADRFGVTINTVVAWQLEHQEFSDSCKQGRDAADERVEQSFYERAVGYTYDSEKLLVVQGEVIREPITRTVFKDLGFKEDWEVIADHSPAYFYDFGNLLLCAVECTSSRSFKPVFLIGGIKRGPRSVGQIEFEMPLTIDSFEQGVALITHAIGKEFDPLVATPWLSDGRKWQDHLPWLRSRARHNKDRS